MKKIFILFFLLFIFINITTYGKGSRKKNTTKFDFYLNQIHKNLDNPEVILSYIDSLKIIWNNKKVVLNKKDFTPRYLLFENQFVLDSNSFFVGRIFSIFTTIKIQGTFDGLLINFADDVVLDSTAKAYGDIIVFFGNIIDKRKNKSIIGNEIVINPFNLSLLKTGKKDYMNKIFVSILLSIVIVLIYKFNFKRIDLVMKNISSHYIKCTSIGFIVIIIFIPLVILFVISIIGIPFIPILVILYLWSTVIGLISLLSLVSNFFKAVFKFNVPDLIMLITLFLIFTFLNEITLFLYSITPIEYFVPSRFFSWINFLVRSLVFIIGIGGYIISYKNIVYYIIPKRDIKYE